MKRNETFRKEVMALEFDQDYYKKYIKGLVTEYLIMFVTDEVQLELRRLDIPPSRGSWRDNKSAIWLWSRAGGTRNGWGILYKLSTHTPKC